MYQACIFDLDGTLCDSVESIAYCANRALKEQGLKEASIEQYKLFVGDGVDELIRRLLRFNGDKECRLFDKVKAQYTAYFQEDCIYRVVPYSGIREMLQELKERGIKLAVLSNKPHVNTEKVIEHVFGIGYFDWILGQQPEIPRKPSPKGALLAAQKLRVKPSECLYVGDTGTDMKTGTGAGMYTVGVLWGFRGREELMENGADCVIERPEELITLLGKSAG